MVYSDTMDYYSAIKSEWITDNKLQHLWTL